tara:strand:+ start:691 stop:1437 length:747 start_codon:yes stop_codon:yes gene_type:complete
MSIKINLNHKNAIVTGGTRGIGKAIVKALLESGANVIATGTNQRQINKLNKKYKSYSVKYFVLELSNPASIKKFAEKINKDEIHILINNAGINMVNNIDKVSDEDFRNVLEINLTGPMILSREFGSRMIKNKWGRIVNIASIWSVVSREGRISYTSSKSGLLGMSKTMAVEWASKNILVNCVSPGFTNTELTAKTNSKNELKEIKNKIPQKRLAKPDEIAKCVLFLVSELNSYITGQNIIIDGGYTAK